MFQGLIQVGSFIWISRTLKKYILILSFHKRKGNYAVKENLEKKDNSCLEGRKEGKEESWHPFIDNIHKGPV